MTAQAPEAQAAQTRRNRSIGGRKAALAKKRRRALAPQPGLTPQERLEGRMATARAAQGSAADRVEPIAAILARIRAATEGAAE